MRSSALICFLLTACSGASENTPAPTVVLSAAPDPAPAPAPARRNAVSQVEPIRMLPQPMNALRLEITPVDSARSELRLVDPSRDLDEHVLTLIDGSVQAEDRHGGYGFLIDPLQHALEQHPPEAGSIVGLSFPPDTRFYEVVGIVYTLGQARVSELEFVAEQNGREVGVHFSLPSFSETQLSSALNGGDPEDGPDTGALSVTLLAHDGTVVQNRSGTFASDCVAHVPHNGATLPPDASVSALATCLRAIKNAAPEHRDVSITADAQVPVSRVVQAIVTSSGDEEGELFPTTHLSAGVQ